MTDNPRFRSPNLPVHFVKEWTERPANHAPVCGAPRLAPDVLAYRTVLERFVTCPACLAELQEIRA
jgi:hypothetical protein